jgi:hypothetical protein
MIKTERSFMFSAYAGVSSIASHTLAKRFLLIGLAPSTWRRPILDFRQVFVERLHGLEQGEQSAFAYRFDHKTIAVTVHDRFIARQFEFNGNPDRLVTAVSE